MAPIVSRTHVTVVKNRMDDCERKGSSRQEMDCKRVEKAFLAI